MKREYFMKTDRIGFSLWREDDLDLADLLWGDPEVTRYLCKDGLFSPDDIRRRLAAEIANRQTSGIQYWPIFTLAGNDLIGACGLRPYHRNTPELGFHLRPQYWHQGYGAEAAGKVIAYAFENTDAGSLFAGHHPDNMASRSLLERLGFICTGSELYPPTGLLHPSYRLEKRHWQESKRI